jgi:DNA polymerase-3 subunit epsilon
MRILFVDTETTGLPTNRNVNSLQEPDNWPDIVSVAWAVYENGVRKFIKYAVIKPGNWSIPEDSIKIHGITEEYANAHGESIHEVLEELREDLTLCDAVSAHNLSFDKNVLFNAYKWRLDLNPWHFWPRDEICTMMLGEHVAKIPSKYPTTNRLYKPPTLKELYKFALKKDPPEGLHNAKHDVEVLCELYFVLWPDTC